MNINENKISDIDKEIIKYINENDVKDYSKIMENDSNISTILALSSMRENIVSWYPFEPDCTILEIGANFGEITGELCKKAKRVVSLESIDEKRNAILKRHKNKKNLSLIANIDEINETFDYITIIGMEKITDNYLELLEEIKKYLNSNGKILLATNNRFAIKNLTTSNFEEKKYKLYTIDELLKGLDEIGFKNRKVYYPMTDYNLTNAIYTDSRTMQMDEVSRNIVYNDESSIKFREENNLYFDLLKHNVEFKSIANSFFIEIFNGDYIDNNIKLAVFSNMRKEQFRVKTIVQGENVYKYAIGEKGFEHIKSAKTNIDIMHKVNLKTLDTYDENRIISKFVNAETLDNVILRTFEKNRKDAVDIIKKFQEEIYKKLEKTSPQKNIFDKYNIVYKKEIFENVKFTEYGLWDLIFNNCFYIDNEFYFYDQEWREENIPVNFIMYRAIKYLNGIRKYILPEELYDIIGITQEQVKIYDELDNKLQELIRNNLLWKIQKQGKTIEELKTQKLTDNHTINLLRIEIEKQKNESNGQNEEINEIKRKNEELQNELNIIKNSRTWKMMEPVRKINKMLK